MRGLNRAPLVNTLINLDPSQHSPSELGRIAHVPISLALAQNDAQPKSRRPNGALTQKRVVQCFLTQYSATLSCTDITNLQLTILIFVHRSDARSKARNQQKFRTAAVQWTFKIKEAFLR